MLASTSVHQLASVVWAGFQTPRPLSGTHVDRRDNPLKKQQGNSFYKALAPFYKDVCNSKLFAELNTKLTQCTMGSPGLDVVGT